LASAGGGVLNDISHAHANYLAAGGINGIILGDGALSYDSERILETYYKYTIADGLHVTADYQFVDNPGYNFVRGPVSLFERLPALSAMSSFRGFEPEPISPGKA
jgi:high affinity Mn2+ porin